MFALATLYVMMTLTNWYQPDSSGSIATYAANHGTCLYVFGGCRQEGRLADQTGGQGHGGAGRDFLQVTLPEMIDIIVWAGAGGDQVQNIYLLFQILKCSLIVRMPVTHSHTFLSATVFQTALGQGWMKLVSIDEKIVVNMDSGIWTSSMDWG